MAIDYLELDLSILEPADLTGIPRVDNACNTSYAPPAILPRNGAGILMIEELNRSPRYMQAPCLQLLTARRLNSYVLPAGWLPCAAINEGEAGYLVDELDMALRSRFINVRVVAEVSMWLAWARSEGVHPRVIDFVRNSPKIFNDPEANPRSWHYVSQFLGQWEKGRRDQELLAGGLAGLVGDEWASAFIRTYASELAAAGTGRDPGYLSCLSLHIQSLGSGSESSMLWSQLWQSSTLSFSVRMTTRLSSPTPTARGTHRCSSATCRQTSSVRFARGSTTAVSPD